MKQVLLVVQLMYPLTIRRPQTHIQSGTFEKRSFWKINFNFSEPTGEKKSTRRLMVTACYILLVFLFFCGIGNWFSKRDLFNHARPRAFRTVLHFRDVPGSELSLGPYSSESPILKIFKGYSQYNRRRREMLKMRSTGHSSFSEPQPNPYEPLITQDAFV